MNQSNTLHAVRIDTHSVTLMPEPCADEGGVPHDPPLARPRRDDEPVPRGYIRAILARLVATVVLVALCYVVAWMVFTLALPKPSPELPRATAKVLT